MMWDVNFNRDRKGKVVSVLAGIIVQLIIVKLKDVLQKWVGLQSNFFFHFSNEYDQHYSSEMECIFLYENNIVEANTHKSMCQQYHPTSLAILSLIKFWPITRSIVVDIFLPFATALLMSFIDVENCNNYNWCCIVSFPGLLYLILPMTWFTSDSTKLKHFCLMLMTNEYILSMNAMPLIVPIVFGFLSVISPESLFYLPFVVAVVNARFRHNDHSIYVTITAVFFSTCVLLLAVMRCEIDSLLPVFSFSRRLLHQFNLSGYKFNPTIGGSWYLHALAIEGYEPYLQLVLVIQMLICMVVSMLVLLRTDSSAKTCGLILRLLFVTVNIFIIQPSITDVYLLILSLLDCREVITQMRYLPYIRIGVVFSVVISFIMAHLWIVLGTGNGNFLFFQGICFNVFTGLFAMEMLNTILRIWT